MKLISDILDANHIILELDTADKIGAISKLLKTLELCSEVIDIDKFAKDVERREEDFPTGLENGTALPHARTTAVSDLVMAFGRCTNGIDFSAPDGNPSHLIFLFGVPRDEVKDYLKTIAQLSRLLKQDAFRDELMSAKTPDDVISAVNEAEDNLNN